MPHPFQTIGLYGKFKDISVKGPVARLTEHLQSRGVNVVLGETTASQIEGTRSVAAMDPQTGRPVDLAIVVGGDGTMLNAARSLAASNIPLIGINLGRLGFLTDIASEDMYESIDQILEGEYDEQQRTLLTVTVIKSGEELHQATAFNDVVVNKGDSARLLEFDVHVDDQFVSHYRADGLIVATPTGSTAYALSSGGPIIYPSLPVLELVPICPHTLSNRPIVLDANRRVSIGPVESTVGASAYLSVDGHLHYTFQGDDHINVTRSSESVTMIQPRGHNHFAVLRDKLGWGGIPGESNGHTNGDPTTD